MSRALAGLGAVVGAVAGGIAGIVIGEQIPPQPGYTPEDDRNLVSGVGAAGVAVGSFIGAFLGAGSAQPKQVGVGRPPARFP